MKPACDAFLHALREPTVMAGFDAETWDRVVRQARTSGLLGRLGALASGFSERLPEAVWQHLEAALTLAEQQRRAVHWELRQLGRALERTEGPVVLLKGAAYAAADLAPAAGRIFTDIDLLVPRAQLGATEGALMLDGWITSPHDAYDIRYYREWMHELPPMRHIRRQTWLDVHHNILPETARRKTQPALFLAASLPLPGFPRFSIPQPADQVLHSATHLFHEGEWQHGLRDLVDLDALLRAYGADPAFWPQLLARAKTLNLGRPLYYALRYARHLLHTPMPQGLELVCPEQPGHLAAALLDALFLPAFASAHAECKTPLSGPAAFALYVRSHWLRMPLHLLIPHLLRKAHKSEDN
ncbi:MAG: nucleotidyltransferase family protein [Gallionellaceae bacterium]|nr:nucleotidyltransferase family protein [Gallionellaceae bacterium]